jgi:hypothetical protein
MRVNTPGGRFRAGLSVLGILALCLPVRDLRAASGGEDGTLEKLIVASGRVALDLDLQQLGGTKSSRLVFDAERDSFFSVLVFNGELRAILPGSAGLVPRAPAAGLPAGLSASYQQLVVEQRAWGELAELVVRNSATGSVLFYVEGQELAYTPGSRTLSVRGRLLVAEEFAGELGSKGAIGKVVGSFSLDAALRPVEVAQLLDGDVASASMPAAEGALVPGPDVIVGELSGLQQFGASGTQVGLAVGTDSCNAGQVPLNWFALPANDHPVIPQNLYRMSGGATNDERFEQVGQSSVKHAFTALQNNICGFGCISSGTGTLLGAGCSDPYSASLNSGPSLGSRAWINPFTGFYPDGNSATPPNNHAGHSHASGPLHRILVDIPDLTPSGNPGATYYAEGQYVTPHEYAWCQAHPGECNMYNNVSYRRFNVTNSASPFTFSPAAGTVRMQPAIAAWTGATRVEVRPAPGSDGTAIVGYKVTNPSPGVWHYEYAIYNQNLDRAIQSFAIPKHTGVTLSNVGFHAPPQHPGWPADGTVSNAGYSSTPWVPQDSGTQVSWSSETFALNSNANAIRWGTMYNIRFDSNRPPVNGSATIGFFKTGSPVTVKVQIPASTDPSCSRNGTC